MKKKRPKIRKTQPEAKEVKPLRLDQAVIDKRFHVFAVSVLLLFAAYQAIIYFGHLAVPNSDFPAFVQTGKDILSFRLPAEFKRLPMLGIMQVILSKFAGGHHPELTAGWLLNAVLHCANVVLLYLIGRKFIGKAAFFLALLFSINPSTIQLMVDPIVETTLVFYILMTMLFIINRSSWCYLFAAFASMTRYEGAALILTAFIIDMIARKTKKQRLTALAFATAASIPIALWMIGTVASVKSGQKHYVGHFTGDRGHVGFEYFNVLWQTAIQPYFQMPSWVEAVFVRQPTTNVQAQSIAAAADSLSYASKSIALIAFAVSVPFAVIKRNINYLAVMIFFVFYVGMHSMRFTTIPRYTVPMIWITLLICFYGLIPIIGLLNNKKIPKPMRFMLHLTFTLSAAIWFVRLLPMLGAAAKISTNSATVAPVAIVVSVLAFVFLIWLYRTENLHRTMLITSVCLLAITSNQFILARSIGQGDRDAEFKMLTEWYVENAPGERIATTMPHLMNLYAPEYARHFLHTRMIDGETLPQFIKDCYGRNIRYVAWDSRLGLCPQDTYYKRWKLQKADQLRMPRTIGPFEFVRQIKLNERRYINIFRLRELPKSQRNE